MIIVLGDLFTDKYWLATARGKSAEANIPICDIKDTKVFPGGAGNVLTNLLALGQRDARYLVREDQNYPTKNRLMVGDTQLARWDENDWCHPYTLEDLATLHTADVVVVSDYGKGSISEEVIQHLRRIAEQGTPVLVDTKGSPKSWVGSEAVLFPNRDEYLRYEREYSWVHNVVLKQSADGLSILEFGNVVLTRPACADFVRSVNGAGDTVIAAMAVAIKEGFDCIEMLEFANAAAAVAVEKPFTAVATLEEVENKLGKVVPNEVYNQDLPQGDSRHSCTRVFDVFVIDPEEGC